MNYPASELVIDPVLIRQYDVSGPRYTSYPTADRFVEAFGDTELRQWLAKRTIGGIAKPLSVYVHLPFCENICYYCACNKVITRDHGRSAKYIKYLEKELALAAPHLGTDGAGALPVISQLHWGGGTPTFLNRDEMTELMAIINARFTRAANFECGIEVDPRNCPPGLLEFLAGLGFNRLSLGVQDFDPEVQKAVHRIQPVDLVRRVVAEARAANFKSINFDLIYGLPKQSLDTFNRTLDQVIELDPDRIALYNYAHLPTLFKPQRRIHAADLPSAEAKLQIMTLAIGRLTRAGYLYIGMDHFARPDDELAIAQRQGRLQRNFQGYSTFPECDLIGLGVSSIGRIGPTYYQNAKRLDDYYASLDEGRLPVARGLELTQDDLVRRAVIQALACHFMLSIESIEDAYLIDFQGYFASEMKELRRLQEQGLVDISDEWITVTPRGRLLVRIVCMAFDRYLREAKARANYSKVI
jgi:oxygen-independent coproporphyrinogen-3 oxidase